MLDSRFLNVFFPKLRGFSYPVKMHENIVHAKFNDRDHESYLAQEKWRTVK